MLNINKEDLIYYRNPEEEKLYYFIRYKLGEGKNVPLIVFGADRIADDLYERFQIYGIEISAFIDDAPRKQGGYLRGVKIYRYEEIKMLYKKYDLVIADSFAKEKVQLLKDCQETNTVYVFQAERSGLIKMDIKGAEFNALMGTKRIIQTFKSALAICVYHKAEDIIRIPQYIYSLVPEYKPFLKQHRKDTYGEQVLYALISEDGVI